MNFTAKEKFLCASRVTGPKHNYIEVELSRGEQLVPICKRFESLGDCRHEPLDEAKIIASVLEGIAEANKRFSNNYCVHRIHYVESDTKPESIYADLVISIITHLEQGGVFGPAEMNAG